MYFTLITKILQEKINYRWTLFRTDPDSGPTKSSRTESDLISKPDSDPIKTPGSKTPPRASFSYMR